MAKAEIKLGDDTFVVSISKKRMPAGKATKAVAKKSAAKRPAARKPAAKTKAKRTPVRRRRAA